MGESYELSQICIILMNWHLSSVSTAGGNLSYILRIFLWVQTLPCYFQSQYGMQSGYMGGAVIRAGFPCLERQWNDMLLLVGMGLFLKTDKK